MAVRGVLVRVQAEPCDKASEQLNGLRLGILIVEANGKGPILRAIDLCEGRVEDDWLVLGLGGQLVSSSALRASSVSIFSFIDAWNMPLLMASNILSICLVMPFSSC